MSKQTAVEWLVKELEEQKLIKLDKLGTILFNKNFATRYELIVQEALAMEKEQMIHTLLDVAYGEGKSLIDWDIAEEYYNKTYKGGQDE